MTLGRVLSMRFNKDTEGMWLHYVKRSQYSIILLLFFFLVKKVTTCAFDGSESHCKELYSVLQQSDPQLFNQTEALDNALLSDGTKSGFKILVLLPGRMECCGKKVVIR